MKDALKAEKDLNICLKATVKAKKDHEGSYEGQCSKKEEMKARKHHFGNCFPKT